MMINAALDEALLDQALQIGGLGTKDATVDAALHEFIHKRQTNDIVELFGNIDFIVCHRHPSV